MKLLPFALVLLAACGSDSLYDPTGHWSMTLTWGAGNCGLQGGSSEVVAVDELASGDLVVRDLSNSNATASGTAHMTEDSATLNVTSVDPDLLRDGGSTTGTLTLHIMANSTMAISGTCSIATSGFFVCSQACVALGTLEASP
jgi:hypothetical protein